jgi:SAM-dependent methyltransferase
MTIIRTDKPLKKRSDSDLYVTPMEFVDAAISLIPSYPFNILDAGAGDGRWGSAAKKRFTRSDVVGVEILDMAPTYSEDYTLWSHNTNYLEFESNILFDCIVSNPPFSFAEEFVRHSFKLLKDGGHLIYLLRTSFLESKKRGRGLFKEFPLRKVYISMSRLSFTGNGKSDDTSYSLYIWERGYDGPCELEWLDWKKDR